MLIETLLISQRPDVERRTSTPMCVASRYPLAEEIHSPVMLRSEAEQLIGQELINTLSVFKQLAVAPSPPKTQQSNQPVKAYDMKYTGDSQSFSH
jgi:hypothetical protein